MLRRHFLSASLAPIGLLALKDASAGISAIEHDRIERLIAFVESQQALTFVRNGSDYSAGEAAEFLHGKLKMMGDEVTSAAQFIEQIGSKSSMTGLPYHVRFPGGKTIPAAHFLGEEFKRIERKP